MQVNANPTAAGVLQLARALRESGHATDRPHDFLFGEGE